MKNEEANAMGNKCGRVGGELLYHASSGASGGSLHRGASFKVEKAHFAL